MKATSLAKFGWAFAVCGLALFGCGKEQPIAKEPPAAVEPVKEITAKPKPGENLNRVFQLADLQQVDVVVAGKSLKMWVMDSTAKTQEGMMFLKAEDVPQDQGMLFAFKEVNKAGSGFWMENTLIPLDIIYVSPARKVTEIMNGKVLDRTTLKSTADYQFVVELKAGDAARLGIKPGSKVEIPKAVVAKD